MNKVELVEDIIQIFIPKRIILYLMNKFIYQIRIEQLNIKKNEVPLFSAVYFEVRSKCNSSCAFCAASVQNEKREDKLMPFTLYTKVINQLKDMDYSGKIAYHVNNDPLIFPNLIKFVSYASKNLPKAWIQIMTNGRALSVKKSEELIQAGINDLTINIYKFHPHDKQPKTITKIQNEIIPKYYQPNQIKEEEWPNINVIKYKKNNFFIFKLYHRNVNEILSSRGGTDPNKKFKPTKSRGFCEHTLVQFNISADGKVSKCCADFDFSDAMGNVNSQSLIEIWNSNRFNHVRQSLLQGNRKLSRNCNKCDDYGIRNLKFLLEFKNSSNNTT